MACVYVSSTFKDLEDFRKAVSLALRRLGHDDIAMEYYVAEDQRPLDRCLSDVASCDVYVGIFAYRYGYVPDENNVERRSITELEYRKAQEKGIPCLIFLLSEEAPWPTSKREKGEGAQRIEILREELGKRHSAAFFETADELSRKINEAIIAWEKQSGLTGERQLTDWVAYREAVRNKHQWVRLQVIAGASKDRGPIRIPLTEVFEAQLATSGSSGTDIPDEVRKYQEIIYGPKVILAEAKEEAQFDDSSQDAETEESLFFANPELVSDLLGRERTQVILGGPGSGKSTILHYAILRLCQGEAGDQTFFPQFDALPNPFLIELRNYVLQKSPDFITYIVNSSRDFYGTNVEAENVRNLLEQEGQAIVMFDGLDEVFDPDERKRVIAQFESFANRYPKAHIIVTSRIAGYDRTALGLAGFEHYTLLPLTLGQIRHFANQWYQYFTLEGTDRTAQGLVQRITENPRLLDLAGNPLLLTMMAVIYKDRDLPNERWRLYERCAETLLEDWDVGKGIEDEDFKLKVLIRTAQKSEILQRVSMYMLEHGQRGRELNAIGYGPLLEIMTTYLEEKYQRPRGEAEYVAVDILHHLMERTYVLAGVGERIFGFVHRTFMEYFAACYCQAQFNKRKSDFGWLTKEIFGRHWNEGEWEEVLLLLIAMLHDQGTPIREVIEFLRKKRRLAVPMNLVFAARCLGEAGDIQDPAQGQLVLTELAEAISAFVSSKKVFVDPALKAFATLAPLVTPPREVIEIIERLEKVSDLTGRIAAWQMGFALRSRKERLSYALDALNDKTETVRRGAIAALEREWPGRADVGVALASVVRTDRQARVRQAALAAMQRSWRSEPAILDAIASRIDEETGHRNVIRLIEYLSTTWRGNKKALELVLKFAGPLPKARERYDDASVSEAIATALPKAWPSDAQALSFLLNQAKNSHYPEKRKFALLAIGNGWGGDPGLLKVVEERASVDTSHDARIAAIRAAATGWGKIPEVLSFVKSRAVDDIGHEVRSMALQIMSDVWPENKEAFLFLCERARTSADWRDRAAAFRAIAKGWNKDVAALEFIQQQAVNDSNPQTRVDALWAIQQWWSFSNVGGFIHDRARNDRNPEVRSGALLIVGKYLQQVLWGSRTIRCFEREQLAFLCERGLKEADPAVRETIFKTISLTYTDYVVIFHGVRDLEHVVDFLKDRADNDQVVRCRLMATAIMAEILRFGALAGVKEIAHFIGERRPFLEQQAKEPGDSFNRCIAISAIADASAAEEDDLSLLEHLAEDDLNTMVRLISVKGIAWKWGLGTRPLKDRVFSFMENRVANDPDLNNRETIKAIFEQLRRGVRTHYSFANNFEEDNP